MSSILNQTKTENKPKLTADIFTGIIEKITGIYVFLMIAVFPVFSTNLYYNLLKDRFYFFFYSTVAAAVLSLMVILVGLAGGALRKQKDGSRPLQEMFRLTLIDKCFLAFLFVVAVSTIISEWVFEAFWGNIGRLQGMLFYLIVGVSWFQVTKFFRFKTFYFYVFLVVGLFMAVWGITDYFGMDIFGWRADANDYWGMLVFTSTIGNVNSFTAVMALYFGACGIAAAEDKKKIYLLAGFVIFSMALIAGSSDNAVLSVLGFFALLPFFCFKKLSRLGSLCLLIASFCLALGLIGYFTSVWTKTPILIEWNWGILLKIANGKMKTCFICAAVFGLAGCFLLYKLKDESEDISRQLSIGWSIILLLVIAFIIYCLIDVNGEGKLSFLEPYRNYFLFTDSWGTNRGYAWRTSFEFFREFSFLKKLFGSGPETYGIFMAKNYYYEMLESLGAVFDSPHSEPIQYLFTMGILGFAAFYLTCALTFVRGLSAGGYATAFAYAAAAYLCASLINISVPITTPLFFITLELAASIPANDEKQV